MEQQVPSAADLYIGLPGIPEQQKHITHDDDDTANIRKSSKSEMDPKKLKRVMSNRISAHKSRMKKNQHVVDMESQAKLFQNQIAILRPQIAASENLKQLLILEQRTLKQQLAVQEKESMLREAKIEMNKAEMQSLRELYTTQKRQLQEQAWMSNWDASISNHFGLAQMVYQESNQGQNAEKTLPNQMLIPGWENIREVDEHKPKLSSGHPQGMLSSSATISDFRYRLI